MSSPHPISTVSCGGRIELPTKLFSHRTAFTAIGRIEPTEQAEANAALTFGCFHDGKEIRIAQHFNDTACSAVTRVIIQSKCCTCNWNLGNQNRQQEYQANELKTKWKASRRLHVQEVAYRKNEVTL